MSKAEERANEAYPDIPLPHLGKGIVAKHGHLRRAYIEGYEQAERDITAIIESRLSEIIGDAQPKPALRAELEELIKRIKNE